MKFPQNYLPVEAQEWVRRVEEAVSQVEKSTVTLGKNMIVQQNVTSAQGSAIAENITSVDEMINANIETVDAIEEIQAGVQEAIDEARRATTEATEAIDNARFVSDRNEVWIGDTPPIGEWAGDNLALSPQMTTPAGIEVLSPSLYFFNFEIPPHLNPPPNISRGLASVATIAEMGENPAVFHARGLDRLTPDTEDRFIGFYFSTTTNLADNELVQELGNEIPYEIRVYREVETLDPDFEDWQEDLLPPTRFVFPSLDLRWEWIALDTPVPADSQIYIEIRLALVTDEITDASASSTVVVSGVTTRRDRKPIPSDFFDGSLPPTNIFDFHWAGTAGESASYRTLSVQNDKTLWIDTTLEGGRPRNKPMTWDEDLQEWVESSDEAIVQAAEDAAQAAQDAQAALDAATSKNKITHAVTAPIGNGEAVGDMWMKHAGGDPDGPVDGWWTWTGTNWVPMELRNEVIANLDAGKITSGTIDANRIGANTITANKLQIGDFNSYWLDPKLLSVDVGQTISNLTVVASDHPDGLKAFQWFSAGNSGLAPTTLADLFGYTLGVSQGDEFVMTYDRKILSGSVGTIRPYFYSGHPGSGTLLGTGTTVSTEVENLANGWERVTWIVRATYASASYATWFFGKDLNGEVLLTNPYLYKRNSAVLIQDGAVTAPKILAGAVEAEKIATNAVRTQHVEANAITASKLSISDFTNYIADAELTGESFGTASSGGVFAEYDWTARLGGATPFSFINSATYDRLLRVNLSGTNELRLFNAYTFEVQEGDEFLISWDGARHVGGGTDPRIGVWTVSNNKTTFAGYNSVPISSSTFSSGEHTIRISGASAKFGALVIRANPGRTASDYLEIGGLQLRRKSGGKLIVDGAIIADKIAANAVTAEKVAANAITADKVAANAITAGKIDANAVTSDKIAANAITAKHTITGATVQTLATANRGIKLSGNELSAYNSSGTRKVLVSGSTGEITVNDGTFTGSTFRTAASGARTEMSSGGISVYNSSNTEVLRLGQGVDTGLSVLQGGSLTPLAPQAFGGFYNAGGDFRIDSVSNGSSWQAYSEAGWSNVRRSTETASYLVQVGFEYTANGHNAGMAGSEIQVDIVPRRHSDDAVVWGVAFRATIISTPNDERTPRYFYASQRIGGSLPGDTQFRIYRRARIRNFATSTAQGPGGVTINGLSVQFIPIG